MIGMQALTGETARRLTRILVIGVKQETEPLKAPSDPNFGFLRSLPRFRRWYVLPGWSSSIQMIPGEAGGIKESMIKMI